MNSARSIWFGGVILLCLLLVVPCMAESGYIIVGQGPDAQFSGYYAYNTLPTQVNFRDASTGSSPKTYLWDFGDGTTSTEENPTHSYIQRGLYTVTLTVTNAYGTDIEKKVDYIAVGVSPKADFSATPTSGNIPMIVQFTDLSRGKPTNWLWNFGDGQTSRLQNPTHIYYTAGTYNVYLTASNAYGSSDATKTAYVTVGGQLVSKFIATPTSGKVPLKVAFTDTSIGSPTSWSWNFADGTTSTEQNPTHTFENAGLYKVQLTVIKGNAMDTSEQVINAGGLPVANFTGAPTAVNVKEAVQFTDLSENSPTAWKWNFGDTATSNNQNPSHAYLAKGIYTVSLMASNANGRDTMIKQGFVNVGLAPIADFHPIINPAMASQVPLYVSFIDQSENMPSSWLWDFGDGTTSTEQNPGHLYYTPGIYTVSLKATNTFGSDTNVKQDIINVGKSGVIGFTADKTTVGVGRYVFFTDLSTNTPVHWIWEFGDGSIGTSSYQDHVYQKAGVYTVTLTTSNLSEQNKLTKKQYITVLNLPKADFTLSPKRGAAPLTVNFMDTSLGTPTAWFWQFGDGETSSEQNPSHTYAMNGNYAVTLTVSNSNGSDSISKANAVVATLAPMANFTVSQRSGSTPFIVQFTDLSTNNPTTWFWQFGDTTTSTEQNPKHVYPTVGAYNVSLTVTNQYGSDTISRTGN